MAARGLLPAERRHVHRRSRPARRRRGAGRGIEGAASRALTRVAAGQAGTAAPSTGRSIAGILAGAVSERATDPPTDPAAIGLATEPASPRLRGTILALCAAYAVGALGLLPI